MQNVTGVSNKSQPNDFHNGAKLTIQPNPVKYRCFQIFDNYNSFSKTTTNKSLVNPITKDSSYPVSVSIPLNKYIFKTCNKSQPTTTASTTMASNSIYPSVQPNDLAEKLFPETEQQQQRSIPIESSEEIVIQIPNSIVHLIDKQQSVQLASGLFEVTRLRQSGNVVTVLARIGDDIQWPLAKDEAAVKLDGTHYFFTLRVPPESSNGVVSEEDNIINYGLTISNDVVLGEELDRVLDKYSAFSVREAGVVAAAVDGGSPEDKAAAYWTTLAPNVEDYSGSVARMIAAGSGQLIKGIFWCGDVTVERLKWGNEFLKTRMKSGQKSEISPQALRRMERVKKMTKMSESVATGLLSGVVKVSGFFTSAIVNSVPGKKFFNLLPGEIILASLDGFNKVCDAVEVAGRNVMATTSTVTTDLVTHKHGEEAAKVTSTGMDAAGHAMGAAWAVFKIRKALNPKSVVKPSTLVKAAASKSK
ncbi:protein EARLY-RESPONSIVE TO DEHYDRATION 7, chloroplastic-like [Bidens hawaiensis]|uniref:protein EARLY-RESPONSIVE TO DEHYDRATION 7, chloroplastic-like n=1 Tax=Bidens hawaiensis TaxID=980011 RepID=UPI00404988C2